jgi:insulysin
MAIEPLPSPLKPKSDWRNYQGFRLENGVQCLVVHDKQSKTTAMSCAVSVGAAADPREMSGLAHFCEHMCFLGSEKYPGENEYKRYLSNHGGRSNASTSLHLTVYKFDVLAEHAEQAVDIFSNFFISPLFTLSGTSREVQAVDSENSKNLTNDSRRRLQILKELASKSHYYSKFTTGNAITLPVDSDNATRLREALSAFHSRHYQPENMTVVLIGPQPLEELQSWIVSRYGSIQKKEMTNPEGELQKLIIEAAKDMPEYVYGKPIPACNPAFSSSFQNYQWPILLCVKPLQSMRKLSLNFPLPPTRHLFNQDPMHLISHLLGHEGPGSSFAILQSAGLITALSAGNRISGPDQALFQLDLALTERGEEEWKSVAALIFEHCRLIATAEDLQRHWDESRVLSEIRFHNTLPGQAYDTAPYLAEAVISYGTQYCLSAGRLLDIKAPAIQEFISYLRPDNCIVERCSDAAWKEMETITEFPKGFGKMNEPWYDVEYYTGPIKDYKKWLFLQPTPLFDVKNLHLPLENRFIPKSLDLVSELSEEAKQGSRIEREINPPNLILSLSGGSNRLWHRLDDRYALPKACVDFFIRIPSVEQSMKFNQWEFDPMAAMHSSILKSTFSQALSQEFYDAELAGLHWALSTSPSGIKISCSGYSDRLSDLAITVLQQFLDGSFIQDSYVESTKDRAIRNLSTYLTSRRADSHAYYYETLLLSTRETSIDLSLSLVQRITVDSLRLHHQQLLACTECEIDCLYTGNVSEATAKDYFNRAIEILSAKSSLGKNFKYSIPFGSDTRQLQPGKEVELHFPSINTNEENGAVLMTFQSQVPAFRGIGLSPHESIDSTASIRLLCHMMREPLFDSLRTKQQLGYVVQSYYDIDFSQCREVSTGIDCIRINVLSPKLSPPEVAHRIDDFLLSFRDSLLKMPDSEIQDHAQALSATLLKPIQQLSTEAYIHFEKIRRFGPEILRSGGSDNDIPWRSVDDLAGAIRSIQRSHLLAALDRVVLSSDRSRVTSMVYGLKFPYDANLVSKRATWKKSVIANDVEALFTLRRSFKLYENKIVRRESMLAYLSASPQLRLGLATAFIGLVAFTVHSKHKK